MFDQKTTETCNLNCKHCFTSGINGPKVYWNTNKIINIDNDKTWYDTNVEHHYHIFNEENSELVDLEPSEIDIKIPKKFSKSQIKKIDLVVKI